MAADAGSDRLPAAASVSSRVFTALALGFLTLGGFAIGASEFAAMGALPQLADDVLPVLAAAHPDVAAARASVFVWGYAVGVVVGAPFFGAASARFPRRTFLVVSLALMSLFTAATALTGPFAGVIALRVIAALPHGAYFGVAAMAAADLMGKGHASRGVAVVLGGLTLANLIGAPIGTWLAQVVSWRLTYVAIAGLFAVASVGVLVTLRSRWARARPATASVPVRARLGTRLLWTTIIGYALLNAAFFAVLTFITPVATGPGRLAPASAVWVLAAAGLGMTAGNYIGGAVADRRPGVMIPSTIVMGLGAFVALAASSVTPAWAFVAFALVGGCLGFVAPFTQVRLMQASPENPQLGSSMNSVCGNIGSATGGVLAGTAIGVVGSAAVAVPVGAVLLVVGAVTAVAVTRRTGR